MSPRVGPSTGGRGPANDSGSLSQHRDGGGPVAELALGVALVVVGAAFARVRLRRRLPQGEGLFAGGDGTERRLGPGFLAILDPGEAHSVRALDGDLVFVAILHGEPTARPGAVAGTMTS